MKIKKWIKQKYPWIILGIVMLGLIFMNICFLNHWLDSDMAAEMMFSKLLAKENHLFTSHHWFYSTEFRVLYTQLIMTPLFHFFSNWHLIRAITNIVFYVLLLCSYFYMTEPLSINRVKRILCAVVLLLPFSENMMLHMQMGNTYMSHVILLFFYYGLFIRLAPIRKTTSQKKEPYNKLRVSYRRWIQVACLVLLAFVFGLSGVRYMMAIQVPLFITAAYYLFQSKEVTEFRVLMDFTHAKRILSGNAWKVLMLSIGTIIVTCAGYLINVVIISKDYSFQTYGSTQFIDVYQGILFERIRDTFGSLLMLFGYIPEKSVLSVRGFISLLAFIMMILIGYGVWHARKTKNPQHQFLVIFFFASFWLNTFLFVFTNGTLVPRYYITSMVFAIPVMGIYLTEESKVFDRRVIAGILCFCLIIASAKVSASLATTDKNADRYGAIQYLENQNYSFGYATYWNGNITQELSNGVLELANIDDIDEFSFFKWSSEEIYYEPEYPKGKVFLLLTEEEANEHANAEAIKAGQKVYDDGAYVIYSYISNEELLSYAKK